MTKVLVVAILTALVFTVAGLSIAAEMGGSTTGQTTGRMGQMQGMSEDMQMRHKMCMEAKMGAYNPAGLVALKDDLTLTQDQVSRLQSIKDRSEQEAKAVLTADQQQKMQKMESMPGSAGEMHKEMSGKMGGRCPLMGDEGMMHEGATGTMRGTTPGTTGTAGMGTTTDTTGRMSGTTGRTTGTGSTTGTAGTAR